MIGIEASIFIGLASILFVLLFIAVGCFHAYKLIGRKRDLAISVLIFALFFSDIFAIVYFAAAA